MNYEAQLITPFVDSGLKKFYKPFIIGKTAFPAINNAYSWRGSVRKREGTNFFAAFPGGDAPVQGLKNWVNPATLSPTLIGFSRTKSYQYNPILGIFQDVTFHPSGGGPVAFSFSNGINDYFWTSNFAESMWTTNNLVVDHIQYFNGANVANGPWNEFQPQITGTPTYLNTALIILPYKGRLVVLNTIEGAIDNSNNISFPQRARWCQLGTPYPVSDATHTPPVNFSADPNAWRSDIPGKGGFIDADTSERIVSADIVKDTLIVAFQRSTWRLRYTGNEILPFIWERLNTQYGAESTYSNVAFDEAVLFFSRYGWIASDTNDVERIDLDIPDDSFSVEANDISFTGLSRIQGIRDYYRQFAYWTFETISQEQATQIYAYNYVDRSWSIFTPTAPIRVFGTYINSRDFTWSSFSDSTNIWLNYSDVNDTWEQFASGQNAGFPFLLGGDINGNVYQMFEFDEPSTQDFVGTTPQNFDFSIATSRFNPYLQQGLKCRLGFVDIYASNISGGEITVQHFIDDQFTPVFSRSISLRSTSTLPVTAVIPGITTTITTAGVNNLVAGQNVTLSNFYGTIADDINNVTVPVLAVLTPNSFTVSVDTSSSVYTAGGTVWTGNNVWNGSVKYTRIFLGAIAHMHQLVFTLSDSQVADPIKGRGQFELQALVMWTRPTGKIRG